jgi:hypothetical protein
MNLMNVGSLVWFDEQSEYLDDDSDSELGDNVDEDSNGKLDLNISISISC